MYFSLFLIGKAAKLDIERYLEAKEGKWLDKKALLKYSEEEQEKIKSFHIFFPQGKGKRDVGILFPRDLHRDLEVLCNSTIRESLGLKSENRFVFPSVLMCQRHLNMDNKSIF